MVGLSFSTSCVGLFHIQVEIQIQTQSTCKHAFRGGPKETMWTATKLVPGLEHRPNGKLHLKIMIKDDTTHICTLFQILVGVRV